MSLNEEYLDDLLKAVTTEEDDSKSQSVVSKNFKEEKSEKIPDGEQYKEEEQQSRHAFSENDLTEMLEHLEEIDAASINDTDISQASSIAESGNAEIPLMNPEYEDDLSETEKKNDEATSMAESAEYMSDIDELLRSMEEAAVEDPENNVVKPIEDDLNELENKITDDVAVENDLPDEKASEDVDIMSLLGAMDDNSDLAEIGDLLQKDEDHEAIANDDMMAILEQAAVLEEQNKKSAEDAFKDETENSESEKKKKGFFGWNRKKKIKEEKEEKEDSEQVGTEAEILENEERLEEDISKREESELSAVKVKKKGIFAKVLDLFFEEEESIEETLPGVGEEGATDENLAILQQLDNEKAEKKKKEKKKKEKKPKEKKNKEKKPKKEKVKKEPKEPKISQPLEAPAKKIPRKKIIMVAMFAISVLAAVLIVVTVIPGKIAFQNATAEYEEQNYRAAYTTLAGMKLDKEEEVIFKKTTVILELQEKYDAYINYDKLGMKIEALNSLFQGIVRYDKLTPYATELKVSTELDVIYQQILSALEQNYGISEEEAREIIAYDKVTYTKKLDSIINGTEFIDPNAPVVEPETLEDMLPEEELMMQEMNNAKRATEETNEKTTEENSFSEEENSNNTDSGESTQKEENELFSGNVSGSDASVDFSKQGIEEQQDDSNN